MPSDESRETITSDRYSIPMPFIYDGVINITRLLYNVEISGQENIPVNGAIVTPNHSSMLDIPISGLAIANRNNRDSSINRGTHIAKEELKNAPIVGNLVGKLMASIGGTIFVNRDNPSRATFNEGLRVLDSETDPFLIVFAEGTRQQGRPDEIEDGVSVWSLRSFKPVLPLGIYYPPNFKMHHIRREVIRVHVGTAIPTLDQKGKHPKEQYTKLILNGMQKAYDIAVRT